MDAWRFRPSIHDAERFFRRPLHEVNNADMWRWYAAREALLDIDRQATKAREAE
jgi:hypothetical protein